ncbi:MAG TPA: phenylalanine--tRNA ligase subunit beta, partial [Firmicutes bacterium]|nr:phenylalanine--tRNA ligase subunit beta [Bacillota bacterium]
MKVTWKWLNEFVDLDGLELEDLEHRLASQGLHIEEVIRPFEKIKEVYIGYITRVEKHPNADRLQVCHVDMGERGFLQIVTAAPNVRERSFVPVAVEGAVLHSGMSIKKAKLRGVESQGMFCSLEELGLEEHSDGICLMEESPEPVKGAPALPYFGLDDTVIDFEITSNRPDCLSVRGIAREVAMAAGRPMKDPPLYIREGDVSVTERIDVDVKDFAKCLRYTARVIEGVSVKESPLAVRCRLALVGLRSINNIVDATNYVMWEYGLPLHAFDRSGVKGGKIIVRRASLGEGFDTLAGEHLELSDEDLLIADTGRGIALAGVIGGENSEITPETKNVVLEAALFDPVSIRMTAKRHGQKTDSSYRFERGMDYEAVEYSSQRAASLIALWGGGVLCRGMVDKKNDSFDPRPSISLRMSQISRHLGISLSQREVINLFSKLDYGITGEKEGLM